jgi:hypothetical protein
MTREEAVQVLNRLQRDCEDDAHEAICKQAKDIHLAEIAALGVALEALAPHRVVCGCLFEGTQWLSACDTHRREPMHRVCPLNREGCPCTQG